MNICLNCGIETRNKKYCSPECYHEHYDCSGVNNSRYGAVLTQKTRDLISIGNTGKLKGRPSSLKNTKNKIKNFIFSCEFDKIIKDLNLIVVKN